MNDVMKAVIVVFTIIFGWKLLRNIIIPSIAYCLIFTRWGPFAPDKSQKEIFNKTITLF